MTAEADRWRTYARQLEQVLASIGHLARDLPDRPEGDDIEDLDAVEHEGLVTAATIAYSSLDRVLNRVVRDEETSR